MTRFDFLGALLINSFFQDKSFIHHLSNNVTKKHFE